MTTSGTSTYESSRDKLIEGALRIVGAVGQGETPTAVQYTEANDALNMLVKALIAQGQPLWAMATYSFGLTTNTNTYRIGNGQTLNTPKPLKIVQAWIRGVGNVDTPMRIITYNDYQLLGNKSSNGRPIQLMYDPKNTYGDIYLFPTPAAGDVTNNTVFIRYQRPFEDFTNTTDTPDFPQEWHEALKYQLAVRLSGEYGMPPNDKRDLIKLAKMILDEALSFGTEEGSLYFGVDNRNW